MNEFGRPPVHVKRNIFEQSLTKSFTPNIYAYFGTFWVKIGQVFDPLSVFEDP